MPPGVTGRTQLVFADEGRLLAMAEDPERFYLNDLLAEEGAARPRLRGRLHPLGDLAILAHTWLVPLRRLAEAEGEYPRSAARAGRHSRWRGRSSCAASVAMVAMFAVEGSAAL